MNEWMKRLEQMKKLILIQRNEQTHNQTYKQTNSSIISDVCISIHEQWGK